MDKGFEGQLRGFHKVASKEAIAPADKNDLNEDRATALAKAVELTQTDPETQEKVYALQKKKLQIMRALKEQLRALDDPSIEMHAFGRTAGFDQNTNTYFMYGKGGSQSPITLGEIMTGGAWGQNYRLNETVPRDIRKKHLHNEARRQLMDTLNQQIAITEAHSWFNKGTGKDEAYSEIAARYDIPLMEQKPGIIAEQLVSSLLTRLAIDHNLPFEVVSADVHADVEYKIDMVIRAKNTDQGVFVETDKEKHDVGIQFTTKTKTEDLQHKTKQAARASRNLAVEEGETVERVVVVSVPISHVKDVVAGWQKNIKYQAGGPDKLIKPKMQEKIFKGVLDSVFSKRTVDQMWKRIEISYGSAAVVMAA